MFGYGRNKLYKEKSYQPQWGHWNRDRTSSHKQGITLSCGANIDAIGKIISASPSIHWAALLMFCVPDPVSLINARQAVAMNCGKVTVLGLPLCTLHDDGVGSCPSALVAQPPLNSAGHSAAASDMSPAHDANKPASHLLCIDGGLLGHPLLAKCLGLVCPGKCLLGWSLC